MSRAAILALAVALVSAPGTAAQWPDAQEVVGTVEAWRLEWGVPGAAVAVVRGDAVLLLEGFGVRELGRSDPVDPGTAFELGSASKTFTAALVALAVDEGLIGWTTPLVELLPELRLGDPWLEREITVLDALAHRTGFGRTDLLWLGGASPEEIVRRLRHAGTNASFRHEFAYSNLMYILVGEALSRLYGESWTNVLAERITGPLGMTATGVEGAPYPGNVARPHVRLGDSLVVATTPRTHVGAAGGILSSATDLAAWMRFQLGATGAALDMRKHWTPLPLQAFGAQYARATGLGYGAGWFVSDYAGRPMVDHIGGHGGMVANVTLLPGERIGVAVVTNEGDNLLPVAVTYHILDLVLGLEPRTWNQTLMEFWSGVRRMREEMANAPGGVRQPDALPRFQLEGYAGRYTSALYGDIGIERGGNALRLRYGANLDGSLAHWHHDTFRITWSDPIVRGILGPSFVSFHTDMQGRPSGLTMTGLQGERIEAVRAQ